MYHCCVSFVFLPSHLPFLPLILPPTLTPCFPLTPLYLSARELFMIIHRSIPAPTHSFTSIVHCLTLLNLGLTFPRPYDLWPRCHLPSLQCSTSPPSSMCAGYLWVIKAAGGCCDWESIYPVAQLWVGSCVCVLLISRALKVVRTPAAIRCLPAQFHASTPAFLRSLFPAESRGHVGLHTLAICPPAFPPSPS